ncbi:hypothetical protein K7432_010790 [Basidiobolus ranarum]|uniref:Uncharacterized protein n=1 Tax=Basidiobolus ranarum TaxID=34480 RepID=A0ABR2WNA2_9FUNG
MSRRAISGVLPEPPKKPSAAVASAEKDEQYFASLFAAVESPAKSPISSNIEVAEQVYFSPGTRLINLGYSGLSEISNQDFVSNNTLSVQNSDSALYSDRQPAQKNNYASNYNPISQQPISVSASSEDNIQRSQAITSTHSEAQSIPNESYQKKDTYSIDSNETESLSSIDRSGSSRSLSREKLPVVRPNSISIPRSTVQPIYSAEILNLRIDTMKFYLRNLPNLSLNVLPVKYSFFASRRAFVIANDRSHPHSYHPDMNADKGIKSNFKFSSSSSVTDSFNKSPTQFPLKSKHSREHFKRKVVAHTVLLNTYKLHLVTLSGDLRNIRDKSQSENLSSP